MVEVTVEVFDGGSSGGDLFYLGKGVYEVAGEVGVAGFLGDCVGDIVKGVGFGRDL